MQRPIPYHPLEYLRSSVVQNGSTGEPVAIFTIPPDDSTPHILGLNPPQAQQLVAATVLLLALLVVGCSAKVDVSTERTAPSDQRTVEKSHTNVAVELLSDQKETPRPPSPPDEPPAPTEEQGKAVEVAGVANFATPSDNEQPTRDKLEVPGSHNVVINVAGDLHVEQHYHATLNIETPRHSHSAHEPVRTEFPSLRIDPRCERSLEEHDRRVGAWKRRFPNLN